MSAVDEDRQTPHADKFLHTFRAAFQTDPLFVSSTADKTFCRHIVPPYNFLIVVFSLCHARGLQSGIHVFKKNGFPLKTLRE
jgi:hypothetical protein